MSNDAVPELQEMQCAVLDPTLPRWRRRYFHQPASGPGRRAFTARRAVRGRPVRYSPSLRDRWRSARDYETVRRAGKMWF